MILLKLFGVCFLLLSGVFAAFTVTWYEKKKVAVLAGWSDLIWYIRAQIDCYLLPLPEILAKADGALFEACSCRQPAPDIETVFRASQRYLDPEARRLLSALVREFSLGNRQELLSRCDYYITALGRLRTKKMEDLPAKSRIAAAICIGSALLVVILLW